jgi:hypothetical protein
MEQAKDIFSRNFFGKPRPVLAFVVCVAFILAALLLPALFGSGERITKSNYEKIQNGMTMSEVEAILGKREGGSFHIGRPVGPYGFSVTEIEVWGSKPSGGIFSLLFWAPPEKREKRISVEFLRGKVIGKSQHGL